ncbi:MAG TPA: class I SAM-dependent methyltransferase [Rhodocyclaceae bacterium]|nr:class I SAM-dependent methyltransferase [Rhodocyclaceae bacterium]
MNTSTPLPTFRECCGDHKFIPLAEHDIQNAPPAEIESELAALAARTGKPPGDIAVLDFGCGRGQLVGQLRRHGWRAFGIEVGEEFVAAGNALLSDLYADEHPILSMVGADGNAKFPAGFFDIVIADQVFEHVSDLDKVAADIARLLKPGGVLLGMFPARFRLVEPHYRLPLVHWLPKGRLQDILVRALVRAGLGVPPPAGIAPATMAKVVGAYAETEIFYRPNREIAAIFARRDIGLDFNALVASRLDTKLQRMAGPPRTALLALSRLLPLVRMYSLFQNCMARGVKGPIAASATVRRRWQNQRRRPQGGRPQFLRSGLCSSRRSFLRMR